MNMENWVSLDDFASACLELCMGGPWRDLGAGTRVVIVAGDYSLGSLRQRQEWEASLECGVGDSLSLWTSHLCPPSDWLTQRDPVPSPKPCQSALPVGMSHTLIYNANPFYHLFPSISPSFLLPILLSLPSFFHFFLPSAGPLFLPLKDHLPITPKLGTADI